MEKKGDGFINQKVIVLPNDIISLMENDKLTRQLYITDIGYYPHATGHYRIRKQGSLQNILIYCTEGEGWYVIDGNQYTVKKNQFFIISANTPHTYAASESHPWSIYWMHFTGNTSSALLPYYNKTYTISEGSDSRFDARFQLFEEIFRNLEMTYSLDNLRYVSMTLWHFLGSFLFIPQFRLINHGENGDVINKAVNFMKQNIEKRLTLDEIASHVKYSPSHFGSLFSKRMGQTPLMYFQQLKIQAACRYLDFSDLKIKEIAYVLGYYDQYHFSKVFSKYIKMSPTEYKSRDKA